MHILGNLQTLKCSLHKVSLAHTCFYAWFASLENSSVWKYRKDFFQCIPVSRSRNENFTPTIDCKWTLPIQYLDSTSSLIPDPWYVDVLAPSYSTRAHRWGASVLDSNWNGQRPFRTLWTGSCGRLLVSTTKTNMALIRNSLKQCSHSRKGPTFRGTARPCSQPTTQEQYSPLMVWWWVRQYRKSLCS